MILRAMDANARVDDAALLLRQFAVQRESSANVLRDAQQRFEAKDGPCARSCVTSVWIADAALFLKPTSSAPFRRARCAVSEFVIARLPRFRPDAQVAALPHRRQSRPVVHGDSTFAPSKCRTKAMQCSRKTYRERLPRAHPECASRAKCWSTRTPDEASRADAADTRNTLPCCVTSYSTHLCPALRSARQRLEPGPRHRISGSKSVTGEIAAERLSQQF